MINNAKKDGSFSRISVLSAGIESDLQRLCESVPSGEPASITVLQTTALFRMAQAISELALAVDSMDAHLCAILKKR